MELAKYVNTIEIFITERIRLPESGDWYGCVRERDGSHCKLGE